MIHMSPQEHDRIARNPDVTERRRSPRIELVEHIHGQLTPLDVPITLLNMSQGGFLLQAPQTFPIGEIHEFRFSPAPGDRVVLRARIVHAMRATAGGVTSYVVGLEFMDRGTAAAEQAIESLVGSCNANRISSLA